ncbi:MAG: filamentous hemagglutinin N-terminal domain-containing protein [Cyanobacteria bacterium J06631_2]
MFTTARIPLAQAQVTSDNTVSTQVNNNGNVAEITGGETRGDNLFHSFQDFSVPTGGAASFSNADNIANIFSRVTGGNSSNIDGLISANGSANLFLINPAGIIFGENASLNLGGSFYGSTADSIVFEEGEFSAADLDNPPLLTVNAPVGFSFRDNPGDISSDEAVLGVNSEQTFALLGGNVDFDGGVIGGLDSNVELGGLTEAGIISLNENGSLSFPESTARGNVSFANSGIILVAGEEGGSISINAQNLSLTSQSNFLAGINIDSGSTDAQAGDVSIDLTENLTIDNSAISNSNFGTGNAGNVLVNARNVFFTNGGAITSFNNGAGNIGDIVITATEDISFDGASSSFSGVGNFFDETATGDIGEINLSAQNLAITNGGSISSIVSTSSNSADITLNIADTIRIDGTGTVTGTDGTVSELPSAVNSNLAGGDGDSGNININAQNLLLNDGGFISAINAGNGNSGDIEITVDVLSLTESGNIQGSISGSGKGSNIRINAADSVSVIGNNELGLFSFIAADINTGGTGEAGNIDINTPQLVLQDAFISADVVGNGEGGTINILATDSIQLPSLGIIQADVFAGSTGNGGNVNIETGELTLSDGSTISAITLDDGDAGNVTIIADESISLSGVGEFSRGGIFAAALIEDGNGGDIDLTTGQLTISDGASISASNFSSLGTVAPGTGEPGNIAIAADSITLENEGSIEATTQATTGTGANIDLQVADVISLTGNSFISAEALGNANGGNLNIDTNFIVAFPDGSNDLIASADQGEGGNINIVAESLLGIEENSFDDPLTNDINASSEFGLDGSISIDVPDINPLQGAKQLPVRVIASENITAQVCSTSQNIADKNTLSIDGRGGVPSTPDMPLDSANIMVDGEIDSTAALPQPLKTGKGDIQPARGIRETEEGQIILTAYRTDNKGDRLIDESQFSCGLRKNLDS